MPTLHQLRTHKEPVEGCFGCKAATVQFGSLHVTLDKKWDGELTYYEDLRKQGIQPAGTTQAKCEEADKKSQETGMAFDAENPYKHVDLSQFEED